MKEENIELVMFVLKDEAIYDILQYLFINEKVQSEEAKSFCGVHRLEVLTNKKLANRIFWKKGKYVGSLYTINEKGKYIFELVSLFRSDKDGKV